MADLKKIVYLTEAQKEELFTNNSVTANGVTVTFNADDLYVTSNSGSAPIVDGNNIHRKVWATQNATVPTGATAGDIVLVESNAPVNSQSVIYVVQTGESNGWSYKLWSNNMVEAYRMIETDLTNYSSLGSGLYGFALQHIATPFTMSGNYSVQCTWQIGSGFAWCSNIWARASTDFTALGVGTSSGSQTCYLDLHLTGFIA